MSLKGLNQSVKPDSLFPHFAFFYPTSRLFIPLPPLLTLHPLFFTFHPSSQRCRPAPSSIFLYLLSSRLPSLSCGQRRTRNPFMLCPLRVTWPRGYMGRVRTSHSVFPTGSGGVSNTSQPRPSTACCVIRQIQCIRDGAAAAPPPLLSSRASSYHVSRSATC